MNPTIYSQLSGDAGTLQTVYMMKQLVNKNFLHPHIRERAASIIAGCNRDKRCENNRLNAFVATNVQYIRDPTGVEALHDPVTFYERMLRSGKRPYGDCDDMATYLATLLKSVGHDCFFRILSRTGGSYHHVHVFCDGMSLDPTLELGKFPTEARKSLLIRV